MRPRKAEKNRAAAVSAGPRRHGRIGVRLSYAFDTGEQDGDALENPVIEILASVARAGSIRHAAELLGKSYRHVWGTLRHWERVFGEPLLGWSQGQRARLTGFAEQLLLAERRARDRARPHIETLRRDLTRVLSETQQDRPRGLAVCASHDLALPVLGQYLAQHENLPLELEFEGSVSALRSLRERRCLLAGFHVPRSAAAARVFSKAFRPHLDAAVQRIWACSRRTQGLMMRREHASRIRSLADVAEQNLRFVNRQVGSGTRVLVDHLMQAASIDAASIPGFSSHVEHTHNSTALCIAGGVSDAGVGVEAAALQYGLHFLPLMQETYYLACHVDDAEHAGIKLLRRVLASPAWRAILATMPGYEAVTDTGEARRVSSAFSEMAA